MKKIPEKYIIYGLLFIGAVVLTFTFFNLSQTVEDIAESILHEKKGQTLVELDNFFNPVISDLEIAIEQAKRGEFDQMNLEEFNKHFLPILKESRPVSSIMMATEQGKEFMILDLDSILINRETLPTGSGTDLRSTKYKWEIRERKLKLIEKLEEGSSYNP
ncbi:MAG: hypothetical protein R2799_00270 [Crocinitomicaceae bacterium]